MQNREYTESEWQNIFDDAINRQNNYFLVQCNIPADWKSYHSGNGEGVWLAVDKETNGCLNKNRRSGVFYGLMNELCFYHEAINEIAFDIERKITKPLPFEYRGACRPVLERSFLERIIGKGQ